MKDQAEIFSIERKGYNRFEVMQFIDALQGEKKALEEEIASLKLEIDELTKENNFMASKQNLVEQTLFNAEIAAQDIIAQAQNTANDVLKARNQEVDEAVKRFNDKEAEMKDVLKRVEYILKSQLALVEKYNQSSND
jgi:cell division septum initiation protein DivIVA